MILFQLTYIGLLLFISKILNAVKEFYTYYLKTLK